MRDSTDSDMLRVLEGVAGGGRTLRFELRDGRRFTDGVCDVLRVCGEEIAILHAHNRVRIRDIVHAVPIAADEDDESESIAGDPCWAAL